MTTYVLSCLRAYFKMDCANSTEVTLREYLSCTRTYGAITLKPLIIYDNADVLERWDCSHESHGFYVANQCAIYEVHVNDEYIGAANILDSILGTAALMESVFENEELLLIPMDSIEIPESRTIELGNFVEILAGSSAQIYQCNYYKDKFTFHWGRSYEFDDALWKIVSNVMHDEKIIYSLHFLKTAHDNIQFLGDDIEEYVIRNGEVPKTVAESVMIENAIHNCYKTIESLYGGSLPNKDAKIKRKFNTIGIDVDELVGYQHHGIMERDSILNKIRSLEIARNNKAAHGNINIDRRSTYYETLDYQALARNLVMTYLRNVYPISDISG